MRPHYLEVATAVGRRPYQEDRCFVLNTPEDGVLMAVADGHGGNTCSDLVIKALSKSWKTTEGEDKEERLKKLFADLNSQTDNFESGTTLSVAYIAPRGRKVWVAILGDSPVIVGSHHGAIQISPEHNVRSNAVEKRAAEARGGEVAHGYLYASIHGPGLQMSRAFGDYHLRRVLNREPEIYSVPFTKGDYVLVATDGVFDPGHVDLHGSVTTVDRLIRSGATVHDVVDRAVRLPTFDNATAILARF